MKFGANTMLGWMSNAELWRLIEQEGADNNEMKYDCNIVLEWFKKHGLEPVPEFRFHLARKWRFDFAFPDHKLALEVEGGIWTGGRHTRGKGFREDMDKYNAAALLGWRVLRTTPSELCLIETVEMIKEALIYDEDYR